MSNDGIDDQLETHRFNTEAFDEVRPLIVENRHLRNALQKIADMADSEAGEPLDDAIKIANGALADMTKIEKSK